MKGTYVIRFVTFVPKWMFFTGHKERHAQNVRHPHQFTTKTLSTKINSTWASPVTKYDNVVTGQGYQKSHRIGKRREVMVEWCLSRENRRRFQKKKNLFHRQFVHHDVTCHPGINPVYVLTGQHLTPELRYAKI